jgi:hypothetical protein
MSDTPKEYRLTQPDGSIELSETGGELGGNGRLRIYGRLDCGTARAALPRAYAEHRVFFKDEAAAIGAGYRPCGNCMRARYQAWKLGGKPGTAEFPWLVTPASVPA